ncbi:MAG: hypothetical protein KF768_01545 [Phycisphaeraceae bacterium]|nr:hypothetical protein [Phycisphaeraceae bacterium]
MRWIRDLALLLVLTAVIGGVFLYRRHQREEEDLIQRSAAAVLRLETELRYRAATNSTTLNSRGWPVTIDPNWFDGRPPVNNLVSPHRPWVEIAAPEEAGFLHPQVRMTVGDHLAQFWYNPWQGVIRARVPVTVNDERTLEVYNRINGCALDSIFWKERPTPVPEAAAQVAADRAAREAAQASAQSSAPNPAATPNSAEPAAEVPVAPILPHPSALPPAQPPDAPPSESDPDHDENA